MYPYNAKFEMVYKFNFSSLAVFLNLLSCLCPSLKSLVLKFFICGMWTWDFPHPSKTVQYKADRHLGNKGDLKDERS